MGLNHFTAARDALDSFQFEEQRGDDLVVKEAIGLLDLLHLGISLQTKLHLN